MSIWTLAIKEITRRKANFASGLVAGGSLIHAATFSTVFGKIPAASVCRLPNRVRSGPSAPWREYVTPPLRTSDRLL